MSIRGAAVSPEPKASREAVATGVRSAPSTSGRGASFRFQEVFQALFSIAPASFVSARASSPRGFESVACLPCRPSTPRA